MKSPIKEVGPSREAWDEAAASDNTPELFILWQGAKQQLRERALAYMAEADLAKRVAELAKACMEQTALDQSATQSGRDRCPATYVSGRADSWTTPNRWDNPPARQLLTGTQPARGHSIY